MPIKCYGMRTARAKTINMRLTNLSDFIIKKHVLLQLNKINTRKNTMKKHANILFLILIATLLSTASMQGMENSDKYKHLADDNEKHTLNIQLSMVIQMGNLDHVKCFMEKQRIDPVAPPQMNHSTPLYRACRYGHLPIVEYLLEQGAHINEYYEKEGMTPFHVAIKAKHLDVVNFLESRGADIYLPVTNEEFAANFGDENIAKILNTLDKDHGCKTTYETLKHNELQDDIDLARTVNHRENGIEIINYCKNDLQDSNSRDDANKNAHLPAANIHAAVQVGNLNKVKEFVKRGVNPLSANNDPESPMTPLYRACYCGHLPIVEYLVEQGAHINEYYPFSGMTPFHVAIKAKHLNVVKFLALRGADIHTTNTESIVGLSNEDIGIFFTTLEENQPESDEQKHPKSDEEKNQPESKLFSHLIEAIKVGNFDGVLTLLKNEKVDINKQDDAGNTPLILATMKQDSKMVQLLLQYNADKSIRSRLGYTALEISSFNDNKDIAILLSIPEQEQSISENTKDLEEFNLSEDIEELEDLILFNTEEFTLSEDTEDLKDLTLLNKQDDAGNTILIRAIKNKDIKKVKHLLQLGSDITICNNDGHTAFDIAMENGDDEIATLLIDASENQDDFS